MMTLYQYTDENGCVHYPTCQICYNNFNVKSSKNKTNINKKGSISNEEKK